MLYQYKNTAEHAEQQHLFIRKWLETRKVLLSNYYSLVGFKPNKKKAKMSPLNEDDLIHFCHHLVEYLFNGHFHIFNHILSTAEELSLPNLQKSTKIHYQLKQNTNHIMDFHDRYTENSINDEDYLQMQQDLSAIGEHLAYRFSLEDSLLEVASEQ